MTKDTLIVNLFAGPGTGKSTIAAETFSKLKHNQVNAELVHEFAKDLTWEQRDAALAFQPYVIAKQMYWVHRLIGKVDVVITDAPILFGLIYGNGIGYDEEAFNNFVLSTYRKWNCINVFLERNVDIHGYNEAGRNQTLGEARRLDDRIFKMLHKAQLDIWCLNVNDQTADNLCKIIYKELKK